jgi:hypothetical protein
MRIDDERVREVESGERPGTVLTRRQHDRDGRAGGQRSVVGGTWVLREKGSPRSKKATRRVRQHGGGGSNEPMSVTGLGQERPSGEACFPSLYLSAVAAA